MRAKLSESLLFMRAWIADPLRVAAVAPSSATLARLITCEISGTTGAVIELGAGTGSFTRALLARGVAEHDLTLVEVGQDFAALLRTQFPGAHVLTIDATALRRAAQRHGRKAGAVVSGLPFRSMPPHQIMAVLAGAFAHMRDDAGFYQFTYGARCPVPRPVLDRLGLEVQRVGGTFRNLPPATVYRIRRARGPA